MSMEQRTSSSNAYRHRAIGELTAQLCIHSACTVEGKFPLSAGLWPLVHRSSCRFVTSLGWQHLMSHVCLDNVIVVRTASVLLHVGADSL